MNNEPPDVGCYQKRQFQKRSEIFTEGREGNEEKEEKTGKHWPSASMYGIPLGFDAGLWGGIPLFFVYFVAFCSKLDRPWLA